MLAQTVDSERSDQKTKTCLVGHAFSLNRSGPEDDHIEENIGKGVNAAATAAQIQTTCCFNEENNDQLWNVTEYTKYSTTVLKYT